MSDLFGALPLDDGPEKAGEHTCRVCGEPARFGYGPPGMGHRWQAYKRQMVWLCRSHRPDEGGSADEVWARAEGSVEAGP